MTRHILFRDSTGQYVMEYTQSELEEMYDKKTLTDLYNGRAISRPSGGFMVDLLAYYDAVAAMTK